MTDAHFDSSVLVKLVVEEEGSQGAGLMTLPRLAEQLGGLVRLLRV